MISWKNKSVYNAGVVGNATTSFSRAAATVNNFGETVESGQRRFRGDTVGYCPPPEFTSTGVDVGAGSVELWGTGWDHDSETPMLVANDSSGNAVKIYSGETPSLVRSLSWSGSDIMQGAVSGKTYLPRGAVIWYGFTVIACQRSESGVIKGISLVYTNDDGATLAVADLASNTEAGGADDDLERLNEWAFPSGFPVNGLSDTEDVWLPIGDYILKTGITKGGQVALARATRTGSGDWTFEGFRSIYDRWITGDSGGHHCHGAAVGDNALYAQWGDVNYRNMITKHAITLDENWLTNPVTDTIGWHGGYSTTSSEMDASPQQVSFVPAPGGGHFGSADLNSEHVMLFEDDDGPKLTRKIGRVEYASTGGLYRGLESLHLSWLPGKGWIGGGSSSRAYQISRDGQTFACFSLPSSLSGRLRILGSKIVALDSSAVLHTADIPQVKALRPLQLNPGGSNVHQRDWTSIASPNPGTGTDIRKVYDDDGTFRYSDDDTAVSPQPSCPPPVAGTNFYEFTTARPDRNLGRYQFSDDSLDLSLGYHFDLWSYPLTAQGNSIAHKLLIGAERSWESHANRWSSCGHNVSFDTTQVMQATFLSPNSGASEDRFLVALSGIRQGTQPMYPAALDATVPDEVELVSMDVGSTWSAGITLQLPENYKQVDSNSVLLTIREDDNNYIEIIDDASNTRLQLDVFKSGSSVGTINLAVGRLQRETPITLIVSCDGSDIEATAIHQAGDADIETGSLSSQALTPVGIINGPISGEKAAIELMAVAYASEFADSSTRESEIRSLNMVTVATLDAGPARARMQDPRFLRGHRDPRFLRG